MLVNHTRSHYKIETRRSLIIKTCGILTAYYILWHYCNKGISNKKNMFRKWKMIVWQHWQDKLWRSPTFRDWRCRGRWISCGICWLTKNWCFSSWWLATASIITEWRVRVSVITLRIYERYSWSIGNLDKRRRNYF